MAAKDSSSSAEIDKLRNDVATFENLQSQLNDLSMLLFSIKGLSTSLDGETWEHSFMALTALAQKAGALCDRCSLQVGGTAMFGSRFEDWE